jgi:hypothetical protein
MPCERPKPIIPVKVAMRGIFALSDKILHKNYNINI